MDDCFIVGEPKLVDIAKEAMKQHFECDDVGELEEYVGCKIEHNKEEGWMRLTQPVLLQSFEDKFDLPQVGAYGTPAPPGQVLQKASKETQVTGMEQTNYRSGVGKLLHMMKWSRPEVLYGTRKLS